MGDFKIKNVIKFWYIYNIHYIQKTFIFISKDSRMNSSMHSSKEEYLFGNSLVKLFTKKNV